MRSRTLALALLLSAAVPAWAASPRIQAVPYDPDHVVTLPIADGYALVVEFAEDERVDSVVVGNSAVWQVTPNKRGDRLVIKPLAGAATTNMVVATDSRRYVFILEPAGSEAAPFVVRFTYPPSPDSSVTATQTAATYGFHGAKALFPVMMSDDGRRTTIRWGRDTPLPAIFEVGDGGTQAIVNGRMVDGDYVIEGTARSYVFQRDKAQAVATRKTVKAKR